MKKNIMQLKLHRLARASAAGLATVIMTMAMLMPVAHAQQLDITTSLFQVGNKAGYSTETQIPTLVGGIIRGFLGLLGVIAILLVIYGGARWMMSKGNDQEVEAAKKILTTAIIGLIIIVAAYAITFFVVRLLVQSSGISSTPTPSTPAPVTTPATPAPVTTPPSQPSVPDPSSGIPSDI